MSNSFNQSAISEGGDQLFLDTADSNRLNIISSNLGLDRPPLGWSDDDKWRAVVKKIALKPNLIRKTLRDVLDISYGPQFSRVGNLAEAAFAGDNILILEDVSNLIQVGRLIIDAGLATEEEVEHCYVDYKTNEVFLRTDLQFDHEVRSDTSNRLISDVLAGAASLVLMDSSIFPTTGYPYPVLVGRGTEFEEVVAVSNNNTLTNTLTCSATIYDHQGPHTPLVQFPLAAASPAGRTFLSFAAEATKKLPFSGFLTINQGGGNEETLEYIENDSVNSILYLKRPSSSAHIVDEPVDFVQPGALIDIATVWEPGTYWFIYETENRKIQVFIPEELTVLGIRDASWLHQSPAAFANNIAATFGTSPTDTEIRVKDQFGFQDEGGLVLVAGTQVVKYILKNRESYLTNPTHIGATSLVVDDIDLFPTTGFPYNVKIGEGLPGSETVAVSAVDLITKTLTIGPTANRHPNGVQVYVAPGTLFLTQEIGNTYAAGTSVNAYSVAYGGTDLEEGNPRDSSGAVINNRFPGPYIYDVLQKAPSIINSTLTSILPPSTNMAYPQGIGFSNIEVLDASLFPAPPYTNDFSVRIGRESSGHEDRDLIDVTLRTIDPAKVDAGSTGTDLNVDPAPGVGFSTIAAFPESSDATVPCGYRIIIDRGGANEEIVTILTNDVSGNQFVLQSPMTITHAAGETIHLINDVLTTDQLLKTHLGPTVTPTTEGHKVEMLVNRVDLVSAASFPSTGGTVYLNFGNERISVRKKITSPVSSTIFELESTDTFPTTDFPYQVKIGVGLPTEELIEVSANNTGTDRLTFSTPVINSHFFGEYVEFITGNSEYLEYNTKDNNTLVLSEPVILEGKHTIGERVTLSTGDSIPNQDGFDYAWHLPPDPSARYTTLFDLIRAAGVQVVLLTSR